MPVTNHSPLTCDEICRILEATRGLPISRLKTRGLEIDFNDSTPSPRSMEQDTPSVEPAPTAHDPMPTKPEPVARNFEEELEDLSITDPAQFEELMTKREISIEI
jgi:hypothetical protein